MRRRELLGALAGVTFTSGCTLSMTGGSEMETAFTVCGPASDSSCDVEGIDTTFGDRAVSNDAGETVTARWTNGAVLVRGRTHGIGDPTCRVTALTDVTMDGSTLRVTVTNRDDPPIIGGCSETREENYYRLRVTDVDSASSVAVRHLTSGEQRFTTTLSLSE